MTGQHTPPDKKKSDGAEKPEKQRDDPGSAPESGDKQPA
ncbi:hypothetical protein EDC52_101432 [Biostraticola tofi]|uniref:Uncharacterized protein n=1 Tax=Biostraticola tofi TaxID=466109 RepID=A0A4R3Z473_9GAMM|nr:hypothetical protein EDC52_101432 [Biostraticola tofi]